MTTRHSVSDKAASPVNKELAELTRLAHGYGEVLTLETGRFLLHERMPVTFLGVLLTGRLLGLKTAGDGLRYKRTLSPGDCTGIGMLHLVAGANTETVEVAKKSVIARFSRVQLQNMRENHPAAYSRLLKCLGEKTTTTAESKFATEQPGRIEHDLLGEKVVPAEALYGIQTLRAYENFPISGIPIHHYPGFIAALGMVKLACAHANHDLGLLQTDVYKAICKACETLIQGRHHRHFIVDVLQGGAGTSANMNTNEVIANLALEELGLEHGNYLIVHPNNHVNLSQSTNDVYPTAFRIAARIALRRLMSVLQDLIHEFAQKGASFSDHVKMGRTQLQDAVPMTLGQEFDAFAATMREDLLRMDEADCLLQEINMGATAIGTGINAPPNFGPLVRDHLQKVTGLKVEIAENLIEATQDTGAYIQLSSVLKRNAIKLSKICNDLRLLSSGPRTGLNEIRLPQAQPGSSIMPGKVNPVIPEVVNQVAYEIVGNDVTISMAAEAGQLQLNAMEPVIFWSLFKSIHHLRQAIITLTYRCVTGIEANPEVMRHYAEDSVGMITALAPTLGYAKTSELARRAMESGKTARAILEEEGLHDLPEIALLLDPRKLVSTSFLRR